MIVEHLYLYSQPARRIESDADVTTSALMRLNYDRITAR
jgi:hypothetical protein